MSAAPTDPRRTKNATWSSSDKIGMHSPHDILGLTVDAHHIIWDTLSFVIMSTTRSQRIMY